MNLEFRSICNNMAPLPSSAWDRLGQAASVMQVTGVDAFGLVSMIAQAALTARRNRDLCRQLALHAAVVGDLLRGLQIPELRRRPETRRPLDQLDDALLRAYRLVRSCCEAEEKATTVVSKLCRLLNGSDIAPRLRAAQEEIDRYVTLIPVVALVANIHAHKHGTEEVQNEEVPQNRPRPTIEEVTEYLSFQELPLIVRQPRLEHLVPPTTEPSVPSPETPSIHGAMASSFGESDGRPRPVDAYQEPEEMIITEVREGSSSGVQAQEGPKIVVIMQGQEAPTIVVMPGDTRPSFLAIPGE